MTHRARFQRLVTSAFCGVTLILLLAAPVFAEEGNRIEDTRTGWIFRWVNFLIVVGAIAYFVWKGAVPQLHERAREIEGSIREAAEAQQAAARELKAEEEKLAALPAEISKMHESAKRDTAAEQDRLRMLLAAEVEKIKDAARAEVEGAERVMRLELKAAAGRMAVERAETLLRERITPQAGSSLIHQFVEDLAEVPR